MKFSESQNRLTYFQHFHIEFRCTLSFMWIADSWLPEHLPSEGMRNGMQVIRKHQIRSQVNTVLVFQFNECMKNSLERIFTPPSSALCLNSEKDVLMSQERFVCVSFWLPERDHCYYFKHITKKRWPICWIQVAPFDTKQPCTACIHFCFAMNGGENFPPQNSPLCGYSNFQLGRRHTETFFLCRRMSEYIALSS